MDVDVDVDVLTSWILILIVERSRSIQEKEKKTKENKRKWQKRKEKYLSPSVRPNAGASRSKETKSSVQLHEPPSTGSTELPLLHSPGILFPPADSNFQLISTGGNFRPLPPVSQSARRDTRRTRQDKTRQGAK